jgi:hypothetical protein
LVIPGGPVSQAGGCGDGSNVAEQYNQDSAITHVDQHGLIDANLSPAVTAPVEHNDVLSHEHHG